MTTDVAPLPPALAAARRSFERWRAERRRPYRIPAPLWGAAVRCAARYGLFPTARALGLDYNSLKRRVMAGAEAPATPPSTFVEMVAPAGHSPPECVVVIERPGGAKLRLELRGSAIPDVADLLRRFVSERP